MKKFFLILSMLAMQGCGFGFINGYVFENTVEPLDLNMRSTPVGSSGPSSGVGKGSTKKFRIPIARTQITGEWDSRGIGDVARREGLSTIYFADMRTISILNGIWEMKVAYVYGMKGDGSPASLELEVE